MMFSFSIHKVRQSSMTWAHEIKSSFNSNLSTSHFVFLYLLLMVPSVPGSDYADFGDDYANEHNDQSGEGSESSGIIQKFELSDVYFAPRWDGEGTRPNYTDRPNKTYCKNDFWWRPYVERIDPPPPAIFGRYLRWKRTSIDTSNVTTTTNTANIFIGTYDHSSGDDSFDREKPLHYAHGVKRSVRNYDHLELMDTKLENFRQMAQNDKNNFGTIVNARRTTPEAYLSGIYESGRVKRAIRKKKTNSVVQAQKTTMKTTTTSPLRKVSMMDPARRAKLQRQIRLTAVPKLRKLTADDVSPTTGLWDKLTALPFYSKTAPVPSPKTAAQFRFIKAENPDAESEYADSEEESLETGDESISSFDPDVDGKRYETLTQLIDPISNSTPSSSSVVETVGEESLKTSVGPEGISSPGPDASEDELRRYWWKLKQLKRGENVEEQNFGGKKGRFTFSGKSTASLWSAATQPHYSEDETDTKPMVFWRSSNIINFLFSLVLEIQKLQLPFLISSIVSG